MTITWFYLIKPGLMVNPDKLFDIQITQSGELKYFIANIILLCCSVQSPRLLSLVLFDWSSQCGCHTILQITTIISSVNDCAALKRIDMVYHYLHHYLHQSDCQSWARLVELLNHGCHRYCLCWVRAEEQWMENIVVNCYESPWEFYQTNAKVEIKIHHVCCLLDRQAHKRLPLQASAWSFHYLYWKQNLSKKLKCFEFSLWTCRWMKWKRIDFLYSLNVILLFWAGSHFQQIFL